MPAFALPFLPRAALMPQHLLHGFSRNRAIAVRIHRRETAVKPGLHLVPRDPAITVGIGSPGPIGSCPAVMRTFRPRRQVGRLLGEQWHRQQQGRQ
jgi:hypothetical protein